MEFNEIFDKLIEEAKDPMYEILQKDNTGRSLFLTVNIVKEAHLELKIVRYSLYDPHSTVGEEVALIAKDAFKDSNMVIAVMFSSLASVSERIGDSEEFGEPQDLVVTTLSPLIGDECTSISNDIAMPIKLPEEPNWEDGVNSSSVVKAFWDSYNEQKELFNA